MATSGGGGGASTSDAIDSRPVKLLCSLGGRILPRPSDGALRYAGGDTRIISLARNSPLPLLFAKLADAYALSSNFLLRYQLPDEGLDSLISVSTEEDLENMLEEYDKLTGASPKLRVFLFTISDPSSSSDGIDHADSDFGLRYLEAVNGLNRKDSLASLASVSVSSPNSSLSNDASRSTFISTPLIDVDIEKGNSSSSPNLLQFSYEEKESSKYRQPLSQLPPLPPAFLINPNNNNKNNCNNKERDIENLAYSEDCNLCQRQLPHAHSDTLIGELGDGKVGLAAEPMPVFHSLRPEDFSRYMAQPIPNYGFNQFIPVSENTHQVPQYPLLNAETAYPHDAGFGKPMHVNQLDPFGPAEPAKPVISDPHVAAPANPIMYSSFAPVHYQSIQTSNMSHFPMMNGAYLYPVESGLVSNHGVNPVYASGAFNASLVSERRDACTSGIINVNTVREQKDAPLTSQLKEYHSDLVMPVSDVSANGLDGSVEMQETFLLDSKLQGPLHVLPPRPKRVASKESISPKEPVINKGLDLNVPIEESGLHNPPGGMKNEPVFEPVQYVKDEFLSQDLQKMDGGLVSHMLSDNQTDSPVAQEVTDLNEGSTTLGENPSTETAKSKPSGLMNFDLPNTEDLGRLQIISNSDLEEMTELGSGTFGTVYHGKWRGSDVAIKRINDRCFVGKPSEQDKMRSDFWNEASKLADLHHPNVVAFYGVVLDGPGGSIATVTEFMVNGSLRHALQRNDNNEFDNTLDNITIGVPLDGFSEIIVCTCNPLSRSLDRRKRLIIAMDAAFGMEYLHSKNIVHFDLKSDNLLVNLRDPHRPICKVGDLGLSKVKCQTLISGGVRGTLPWMAPELLNGGSSLVSEKVDVFSFGIVLWELLTGEEPYADLHYGVIIGGIVNNTLRPQVPESCDPEWRSLMEQCWSSEPSDRPSFTEIVSRLRSMATSPQKTS